MATAQVMLDTTQYVRVTDRFDVIWLQCLRDTVRIVFSDEKPARSNTAFHLISGDDPMVEFHTVDKSLWALATTNQSSLIITSIADMQKTFSTVTTLTIPANTRYSVRFEKNANIAVQLIKAKGLTITAVIGDESGAIVALTSLLSVDGLTVPKFRGVVEIYDGPAIGDMILTNDDILEQVFYPDGKFVIDLFNDSNVAVTTHLSIAVTQVSITGVYTILEPNTQLEPTTEMSTFNGTN